MGFCILFTNLYFDLIATTGSSRAAIQAGTIPDITPIIVAVIIPLSIFEYVKTNFKDPKSMKESSQTNNIPTIPPITLKNTASNKNWNRIK